MTGSPLRHLRGELAELERRGLLRDRPPPIDRLPPGVLHLCSNDYLGYRFQQRLARYAQAAAVANPVGAGASRLVAGEHAAHRSLEKTLAEWLAVEETLIFTSGYAANVGWIAALAEEGDLIVSDALNHASIIDGCRLSRARCVVVRHGRLDEVGAALRQGPSRRRWVVTESYFSMEGSCADLVGLRAICDELDAALVIDEAHALGVFGPEGRGCASAAGVRPDVLVGTLGKALGAQGAFVAGSGDLVRWLWNRARSFVFSTGLSPLLASIAIGAVAEVKCDDAARASLRVVMQRLRRGLRERGIPVLPGDGPILPVVLGSESNALAWSRRLEQQGVMVQAIRPPTVSPGTSRLRVTARADLTSGEIERALSAFADVAEVRSL